MIINFTSSKDSDEIRTMHTTSNNIEIMMGNETDEIIEELFDLFCKIIEKGKKKWDDLLHYNLHKISLNRGGSYIDSPR